MSHGSEETAGLTPLRRALLALQQMQAKLDAARDREREPIAVVGYACRFPGAPDADSYWRLLHDGVDAVTPVPGDRWDADAYYDPDPQAPGKMVTRCGGFLTCVDEFDAAFFSIAPREAVAMDPQQRLLLEIAAEAFEHAGQPPARLAGSRTGVFVGISTNDYSQLQTSSGGVNHADAYSGTGNAFSVASGRISYVFGLEGPSLALDTACSSSLVAVHLACQSLKLGESAMAIAGGVNLMLSPLSSVAMSKLGALSPDGRCRTFDTAADGYVRAEGCGLVVLKRLRDAERDGDRVYAIIRGSAVSQDGRSGGLTVPNGPAQEAVVREALGRANVAPALVSYVEAHGTATPLGDPIEVEALCRVLGKARGAELFVGSVKTNFGHAESAAGIAGLLKVILSLVHRRIPAHLHFNRMNEHIHAGEVPLRVPTTTIDWTPIDGRRIAGVSAFGFSGTNAHVIVEEAPDSDAAAKTGTPVPCGAPYLLPVSARDEDRLRALSAAVAARIHSDTIDLDEVIDSAWRRRAHHRHRIVAVGGNRAELAAALAACGRGESSSALVAGIAPARRPKIVFVFPGQGSQWQRMGARLFENEPVFRESVERCRVAMRGELDRDLVPLLCEAVADDLWSRAEIVQPLLFTMQVSLVALLRSWDIDADAVVGHSMGEIAAAHVAGALSLEDASRIICVRSRLVQRRPGGKMAVVELSSDSAEEALRPFAGRVALAGVNGPDSVIVAGEASGVLELLEQLAAAGTFARLVDVDYASHSAYMEPLLGDLRDALRDVRPGAAVLAMVSTVTAQPVAGSDLDAAYWAKNLRQPVLFFPAIERLARDGCRIFLEICPHPILSHSIDRALRHGAHDAVPLATMRRDQDPIVELYRTAAALHAHGVSFEAPWQQRGVARALPLPPHPWRRERYWIAPPPRPTPGPASGHPLLGRGLALAAERETVVFETELGVDTLPLLEDHRIEDVAVLAGAAYVEMALAAARAIARDAPCAVEDLALMEAMTFGDAARTVQTRVERSSVAELVFQIASRIDGGSWTVHARGRVRTGDSAAAPHDALTVVKDRCSRASDAARHYEAMAARGLVYGPAFRSVRSVRLGHAEALGEVRLADASGPASAYVLHPAVLDGCLQLFAAAGEGMSTTAPAVPIAIGAVRVHRPLTSTVWAHAVLGTVDGGSAEGDVLVFDGEGHLLVEVRRLRVKSLEGSTTSAADPFVAYEWRQAARPPEVTAVSGRYLLVADRGGTATHLASALQRAGASVHCVFPSEIEPSHLIGQTAVVLLSSLDCPSGEQLDLGSLEETRTRDYRALLQVIQDVARQDARDSPRIWLVTRGAQAVGREPLSVAQAPLWGLSRTVVHELPRLELTRIDLAPGGSAGEIGTLLSELASNDHEDEIALRHDSRYVGRLVRHPLSTSAPDRLVAARRRPFQLRIDRPGVLDRLALRPLQRRMPGRGEVEIEVAFASVNFIDVLKAMGVYPGQDDGSVALGGECAGRITEIGEGVLGLRVGDEVVALAAASIATHVTTPATYVVRRPEGLDPVDAAAAPAAFMTAWIALHHLAKLERGERILIHSASGGAGLAAIEIATRIGAEIYATAGNEEKRAFLASRGVRLVTDSRSLNFADAVLDATGGRGVDVVLNSLSGEAIDRSLAVVAPYGRFVELGKRDIYENAPLRLGHFKRRLSYFALDLAAMIVDRPGETAAVLHDVIDSLATGRLTPLPRTIVPVSRVADAFRTMAAARHIGKLVIDLADPEAHISIPAGLSRAADGTVLITGGLGGLGLAVARRLVDDGARRLVLVGRRGIATPQQADAVVSLERSGAEVVIAKADVADAGALRRVLDAVAADGPKLCGVVHAAGVLADALLIDQTAEHYAAVMAPKIAGAWNLHALTKDTPLDFFVLYSSAASVFGAPGQGNYAAANAFLDALAHHRRAIGLPALSINWGAFSEVGLAAARDDGMTRLAALGIRSLTPAEGNEMLARLLESGETQIGVVPLDMRRWLSFHPRLASSSLFSELVRAAKEQEQVAPSDAAFVARLRAATVADRRALIEGFVIDQVAHVVRLDRSRIESSMPFKSLGIDSLMGLELRNRLESALGVRLPATLVWSYGDAEALAGYLATRFDGNAQAPAADPATPPDPPEAASDVERRLAEKLAALRGRIQ